MSSDLAYMNDIPSMFFTANWYKSSGIRICPAVVAWRLALAAKRLTVPPMPSQGLFPCEVPEVFTVLILTGSPITVVVYLGQVWFSDFCLFQHQFDEVVDSKSTVISVITNDTKVQALQITTGHISVVYNEWMQ